MALIFKNIVRYLFIVVLISSGTYLYYLQTDYKLFRIISAVFLFSFYGIATLAFFKYLSGKPKKQDRFFVWYTVLICGIFIYSIRFNENDIRILFLHPLSFSAFFICVVVFFVRDNTKWVIYSISRYLTLYLPFLFLLEILIWKSINLLTISYTCFFYSFLFASQRLKKWIVLNLIISAYLMVYYDFRTGFLIVFFFLLLLVFRRVFVVLDSRVFRSLILLGVLVLTSFIFFNFTIAYNFILSLVGKISINTIDTRSFLFIDFYKDIKGLDLLVGRGYLGTYHSQYFGDWTGERGDHFIRFVAEIGFLQIILRGGVVLLIAFFIVCFRSIYIGFVLSIPTSWQFLASGWLLLELMILVVESPPTFNLHFFYIWLLIGLLSKNKSKNDK